MKLYAKILITSLTFLMCLYLILGGVFLMNGWSLLIHLALYIGGGGLMAAALVFLLVKKDALLKTDLVIAIMVAILLTTVVILNYSVGLNELDSDQAKVEKIREIILSAGGWAMAVYVLVQILQVVILPLPALVCYVPGTYIWNWWIATLLASAGVLIGTVICYVLGRFFGRRIVEWIAGKETTDKYADYLGKRGKLIFVMMQILPFFPDDILCMIAGLTKMSFPFFLASMILIRPAIIAVYCTMGGGQLIPFSGWGIPVWIAIMIVCITLAVLSFKYQDKIEGWLKKLFVRERKGKAQAVQPVAEAAGEVAEAGDLSANAQSEEQIKDESNAEPSDDSGGTSPPEIVPAEPSDAPAEPTTSDNSNNTDDN